MNRHKDENLKESFNLLMAAKIEWQSFNNDMHWRIGRIDFYPTTQRWIDQKYDFHGRGVAELIEYIKIHKPKDHPGPRILTVEQIFEFVRKSKKTNLFDICEAIHQEIYQ